MKRLAGKTALITGASSGIGRAIAKRFREKGSDAWFTEGPAELLSHWNAAADPDGDGYTNIEAFLYRIGKPG